MEHPCSHYKEDWAVCHDFGEPKGQCENCGFLWFEHSNDALPPEEITPKLEEIRRFQALRNDCYIWEYAMGDIATIQKWDRASVEFYAGKGDWRTPAKLIAEFMPEHLYRRLKRPEQSHSIPA